VECVVGEEIWVIALNKYLVFLGWPKTFTQLTLFLSYTRNLLNLKNK